MFRGFKNSEFLKYSINSKIDKEFSRSRIDSSINLAQLLSSVFSASLTTILITTLNDLITVDNAFGKFFAILGIAIAIIVITYFSLFFLIGYIFKTIREKRVLKFGVNEIHELIEQFDNLACDSILIVEKYIEDLKSKKNSKEIDNYYIYEAIHYLKKAVGITEAIIGRKDECTCEKNDTSKIDMFRIRNLVSIMKIQIHFLATQVVIIDLTAQDIIKKIEIDINELEKQL